MKHASGDEVVSDYRKALMMASELRAVGAHEQALIWAHLASFLQDSETYIFQKTNSTIPKDKRSSKSIGTEDRLGL